MRSALLAGLAAFAAGQCDEEYECMFRAPNSAMYDLRPLCTAGRPYVHTNPHTNDTYKWMVCGNAPVDCIPPYDVEYQRGVAVQFFGDEPKEGELCKNKAGVFVPCTRDCEVLGTGTPIITLAHEKKPLMGVNITHYGVPSLDNAPFQCPIDPIQGGTMAREVTIQILCNKTAILAPHIIETREVSPCKYLIVMQSKYGCGCEPNCYNRNCGSDGCFGSCGPVGHAGICPDGLTCNAYGQCCRGDCRGRQCGDNGCGISCGTCQDGYNCTRYQQCVATSGPGVSPLPSMLPSAKIYTTTGGDKFAAYAGGAITAAVLGLAISFFLRARAA